MGWSTRFLHASWREQWKAGYEIETEVGGVAVYATGWACTWRPEEICLCAVSRVVCFVSVQDARDLCVRWPSSTGSDGQTSL